MCIQLPIVVDKTGVRESRRLGPFPRLVTRGNGLSWLVAGSPALSTTCVCIQKTC